MITIQNRNQLISIESVNAAMSRESDDNDKKELTELQKKKIQAEISKIDDDIEKKEKRKKIIKGILIGAGTLYGIKALSGAAYRGILTHEIIKNS